MTPVDQPNSAAGDFSSEAQAAAAGNRKGVAAEHEVAVLAGGCFWGMETLIRKVEGVVDTDVGYIGGEARNARYERITVGDTDHAEAIKVVYDPARLSYERLVTFFFRIHDPTTVDRQGNDRGTQYRSAIFAQSPSQVTVARAVKDRLDRSGKLGAKVVTQIVPTMPFYVAEEHHQDYLEKHPHGYNCHYIHPLDF